MTSNMGSHLIQERLTKGYDGEKIDPELLDKTREEVIELLKQQLKPEFLNRVDEIVLFEPLSKENIREIVELQLKAVQRLLAQNGILLEYSEAARNRLAEMGYDPLFGARPVKRTIQREVVNTLSKRILAGEVERTRPIRLDAEEGKLTFSN